MPRNDLIVIENKHRIGKPEALEAHRNPSDLFFVWVLAFLPYYAGIIFLSVPLGRTHTATMRS